MPQHSPGMGPCGDEPLTSDALEPSGELSAYTTV